MKKLFMGLIILIVFCIIATSCDKDDDPTQTELLCREWEVISIDGESLNDYFDEAVQAFYQFEVNGDCAETLISEGLSLSLTGKWNWADNEKTVEMEFESEGETLTDELKVQKLTTDEFWFTDASASLIKCEPK